MSVVRSRGVSVVQGVLMYRINGDSIRTSVSVRYRAVSVIQRCPLRGVPLYNLIGAACFTEVGMYMLSEVKGWHGLYPIHNS